MYKQKSFENNQATLYLVATPIGNLDDISFRALEVLKSVDCIFAEDTRHSKKLLSHFKIATQVKCYQEFNQEEATKEIINLLKSGKNIALISDAGTPLISDPGFLVVKEATSASFNVVSIPGASALISALIVSGLPCLPFTFVGFLNAKTGKRKRELMQYKDMGHTLIFYEAPHRLKDTLSDMLEVFGNRKIALIREMTKKHEEVIRGEITDIIEVADTLKGEMVIVCDKGTEEIKRYDNPLRQVDDLILAGMPKMEAIKVVAKNFKKTKQEIYKEYISSKENK